MKFPHKDLRNSITASLVVPVVNPGGTIKHVRVSNTIDTPILRREFAEHEETGAVVLVSVTVSPALKRSGWELLEDLYNLDGEQGPERWRDYVKHMGYVVECEAAGQKPDAFPVDRLPEEVLMRRRGETRLAKKFTPTSAPRVPARRSKEAQA